MTLLLLGVLEGGQAWAWGSPASIAVFAGGAVAARRFALVERRAAEPVLPLWVFSRRLLATTTFLALGIGVMLIGLDLVRPDLPARTRSACRRWSRAWRSPR